MPKLDRDDGGLLTLGLVGALALAGGLRGRGSQARLPKVQVKLGYSQESAYPEDGPSFPLLSRRGRDEWREVGTVESDMVNLGGFLHDQWVIDSYTATIWGEQGETFTVQLRNRRDRIIKTPSAAKREIKAWAVTQIEGA